MPDWYQTKSAKKEGFGRGQSWAVCFAQLLYDKTVWQRGQARQDEGRQLSLIPKAPKITGVIPAADQQASRWRYTFARPTGDWTKGKFRRLGLEGRLERFRFGPDTPAVIGRGNTHLAAA